MAANVQSLTAISEFRSALCTFIVEARQALAALEMEARRALEHITHDQAQAWRGEVRRGREKVQQCKLEIHNTRTFKRIADYTPSCIDEKKDLAKAESRLHLAERKVEAVRHWGRVSEQAFREFQARLAQFVSILDGDLPKAVAALERMLVSLDRYLAAEAPRAAREPVDSASNETRSRVIAAGARPTGKSEDEQVNTDALHDGDNANAALASPNAVPTGNEPADAPVEEDA